MANTMQGPPVAEGSAAVTISDQLQVSNNVLVSPQTSISIHNIATISIVPIIQKPLNTFPLMIVVLVVAGFFINGMGPHNPYSANTDPRNVVAAISAVVIFILFVVRFSTAAPEYRLQIGASDGSINYFRSPKRETLQKVRDLLTERLDKHDSQSNYVINFQNGNVQILERGASIAANVQGDNSVAAAGNSRVGSVEVSQSPGAQIGNGNFASGNSISVIDYSQMMPHIQAIRSQYTGQQEYAYIVQRLDKLEELMKAGTKSESSKRELRALIVDLSQIFSALPNVAGVFRAIGSAAGFAV